MLRRGAPGAFLALTEAENDQVLRGRPGVARSVRTGDRRPHHADEPDRAVTYTARLKVIGYYYYLRGTPRERVKVNWKGDETRNEIDFVNRTLDEAYAWLTAASAEAARLSEQAFGDMVYSACMSGEKL
ncbi:MAG: hypothetical protein ACREU7_16770 [Burkholderiales bacterium]